MISSALIDAGLGHLGKSVSRIDLLTHRSGLTGAANVTAWPATYVTVTRFGF